MSTKKSSNNTAGQVRTTRTRVGKYELGRTLGERSFAKVKFAKNVETGECVAIKILDREQVLHRRIVEQVMASKTKIYIVIEYVGGGELFDKIVSILSLIYSIH
ncbi:hypothetical protein Godav_006380 [Gossypium davidsonii]|uniref:Protein kinase domain-containing protein n=1 Tax=Gossypium davidsonii TaxID=34287 RepID=A0A7J8S418_GOSDV|nr:hypothetical protein [Gossypium davidsonii]